MPIIGKHPFLFGLAIGIVVSQVFSGTVQKIPGVSKLPQKS